MNFAYIMQNGICKEILKLSGEIVIYVKVREDEPFEKALRKFKNKWVKAGILREVRSRSYYLKPSEARKIAKRSKRKRTPQNSIY